jgi:nucleoside 2-deoxyribosyltransferase
LKSLNPNLERQNSIDKNERKEEKKVYCSGALFCPVEVAEMADIAKSLENVGYNTYLPQRDGGEAFVMNSIDTPIAGSPFLRPFTNYLTKVMFALDIYEILKCDYFIINLNGRVPDDGAVSELGVAFASGRPIIQFKSDLRSLFNGRDHPMIAGAALYMPPVNQLEQIPGRLEKIVEYVNGFGINTYEGENIPRSVQKIVDLGFKVWKFTHDKKKPQNQMTAWL